MGREPCEMNEYQTDPAKVTRGPDGVIVGNRRQSAPSQDSHNSRLELGNFNRGLGPNERYE